ncbi:YybS family protein [Aquicella lusitana]|uniref:Uncharacterized protein n=1 Tax=Aquicella lusitana TaxID=254246 RepID=A0A370GPN8_9COXI|nr:hypothetical protein [Aquicella lusitana]RDI45216.1 hypothetical protein C8D86_10795 [Aquicella lusitana]VVC72714.1 hypothetical protein AQULUS_04350 [Aquicella lusitana]
MWLQRFTNYLLDHRWQTIALAFVITFIPIIGIVGILIAAFMTLRKSIAEGAVLTVAATLPYVISFFVAGHEAASPEIVVWAAVSVAVFSNILTWVFAVMLRRKASWSTILQLGALTGVLVVSVIHLVFPDIADWWASQLQSYYAEAQAMTAGILKAPVSPGDTQLESINITKQYASGLIVAGILFNGILQLIIARWWQAVLYAPGSMRRELQSIRLSSLAGVLFIVSLVLSYLGNSVVLDIMPILYILFGAAGLSLIHYLFRLMSASSRWFWILLLYVTLVISLPTSMIFIAVLALADIWLDMRKRVSKV